MRTARAPSRSIDRPLGRRKHRPAAGKSRELAVTFVAPPKPPELPVAPILDGEARWPQGEKRHRSWGGMCLSLGLHLGAIAILSGAMLLRSPDGLSPGGPAPVEVEIIDADAYDSAFASAGPQSQVAEAQVMAAPLPEIPLPPLTQIDLAIEADVPQDTKSEALDHLKPLQPPPTPSEVLAMLEPEPQPRKVETSPKNTKTAARSARPVAQGKGTSKDGKDASSALAAARGSQGQSGAAGAGAVNSFRSRVMAHLIRYKRYPDAARIQRITGRALATFSLDASGRVTSVSLASSSGHALLDSETLAMVRRASPFPPIPPETALTSVSFTAPIVYDVN